MAGEPLAYWDYVKAAFWQPVRSRVLGRDAAHADDPRGFGLARLLQPRLLAARRSPAMVAYLGGRSSSARFQKLVQGERIAARAEGAEDKMQKALERLQPASQSRYRALRRCSAARSSGIGGGHRRVGNVADMRAGSLNQLLWLFLRLLASRETIQDTLAARRPRQLEAGIESLKTRLAAVADPEGALARSLQATLEIQEQAPREPRDRAANNLAVIDAELERIEQQVRLVREESAVSGSPEALSARLDSVVARRSARPRAGWTSTPSCSRTWRRPTSTRRCRRYPPGARPPAEPAAPPPQPPPRQGQRRRCPGRRLR